MFRVDILASDGGPGLLRFTWAVPASSRTEARTIVRRKMRERGKVVRVFRSIRRLS